MLKKLMDNLKAKSVDKAKKSLSGHAGRIALFAKVTAIALSIVVSYVLGFMMAAQKAYHGIDAKGDVKLKGANVYLSGSCAVLNTSKLINLLYQEAKVTFSDDNQIIAVLSNLKEPMTVQCSSATTTIDYLSYPDLRDALGGNKERRGKISILEKKVEVEDAIFGLKGKAVVASGDCKNTSSGESSTAFTESIVDVLSVEKREDQILVYIIKRSDQASLVCDSKSFIARLATSADLAPKAEASQERDDKQKDYSGRLVLVTSTCKMRGKTNRLEKVLLSNQAVEISSYKLGPDGKFQSLKGMSAHLEAQVFCDASEWPINVKEYDPEKINLMQVDRKEEKK